MNEVSVAPLNPQTSFRTAVRQRALRSATELVKAEGWHQLRINQIAQDVGVSRPTIYAEFGTKEDFIQALLRHQIREVMSHFASALRDNSATQLRALEVGITQLVTDVTDSPIIAGLLLVDEAESTTLATAQIPTENLTLLLTECRAVLAKWLDGQLSTTTKNEISASSDTLSRLILSHLLTKDNKPKTAAKQVCATAIMSIPELAI